MQDLTISLIQTSVYWEDTPANLEHFANKMTALQKSDFVVLPETFNTGFTMNAAGNAESMNGSTVSWMKQQASKHHIHLAGTLIIKEGDNFFNRFIMVNPAGELSHYDKRHAFSMGGEDKVFTKGDKRVIWETNGWKICPQVCYDLRFPVWSRNDSDYDLLLYTANWPTKRISHWLALAKARAIENQCYVAAVSRIGVDGDGIEYNGNSVVYDFNGDTLTHNQGEDTVLTTNLSYVDLQKRRTQFPVLKDGDSFSV